MSKTIRITLGICLLILGIFLLKMSWNGFHTFELIPSSIILFSIVGILGLLFLINSLLTFYGKKWARNFSFILLGIFLAYTVHSLIVVSQAINNLDKSFVSFAINVIMGHIINLILIIIALILTWLNK